ncbi:hypothetical protein [Pseudomonas mucidolens]|uniref:hypothetical protein n=1 Tax=Pseudomonas mucidolens TaxID=46679 RepID=UPI0030DAA45F
MTASFVKLDTFISFDRKHILSRCQFNFTSVTIGDFDQITMTNTLVGSFEDLIDRLSKYKSINCNLGNVHNRFTSFLEADIRNSCLPIGVESFDGDLAAFFVIGDVDVMLLKPWGAKKISFESISLAQYKNEIAVITSELVKQKNHLVQKLDC